MMSGGGVSPFDHLYDEMCVIFCFPSSLIGGLDDDLPCGYAWNGCRFVQEDMTFAPRFIPWVLSCQGGCLGQGVQVFLFACELHAGVDSLGSIKILLMAVSCFLVFWIDGFFWSGIDWGEMHIR